MRYFDEEIELIKGLNGDYLEHLVGIFDMNEGADYFVFGNGGSASTASHLVADLVKLKYRAFDLTSTPTLTAIANDSGYENVFLNQLSNVMGKGEYAVAVAISASGNSENILKAIRYARKQGAYTIGLTGFDGGKLRSLVDLIIHIPSNNIRQVEDIHLMICHYIIEQLKNGIN